MKEINNFDKLRQFLAKETTFVTDNKKSIIWIWVVMRAKDNAEHKERTIKSYHIQSLDDFDYKKDEIIDVFENKGSVHDFEIFKKKQASSSW